MRYVPTRGVRGAGVRERRVIFVYSGYENLGVEYLSAVLHRAGFSTCLLFDPVLFDEPGFMRWPLLARPLSVRKALIEQARRMNPLLICFSVVTDNYLWAREMARGLKEALGAPIVFGGIHPTSVPERVIREPFVDYVCVGEGEEALVGLARALRDGGPTLSLANIWTKQDGRIFSNAAGPLWADLDTLPFADKDLFYRVAPVFRDGYLIAASRGCPFRCAYCCHSVWRRLYGDGVSFFRIRSVDNVLTELEAASGRYRPAFVHFTDDVINARASWLEIFLEEYPRRVGLPFSCYLFPSGITPAQVGRLRRAGCFKVQLGLQRLGQDRRRALQRPASSDEEIGGAIDLLKRQGIYVVCDAMFGFSDQGVDEVASLARFYHEHTPDYCENYWLRYYPGTEMTREAFQSGAIRPEKMEQLEGAEQPRGLFRFSEYPAVEAQIRHLMAFVSIVPILPRFLASWILKWRVYRYFPSWPTMTLMIILKLMRRAKHDFYFLRTIRRYGYYLFSFRSVRSRFSAAAGTRGKKKAATSGER